MVWTYIWLAVVVISLVIEFVSLELVSIWFSIGSFIAMILALCGVGYEIQIAVAIIVSLACILGLRKVTLKLLNKDQGKTNMDLAVGTKTILLTDASEEELGTAKYNGVVWSAKPENGKLIKAKTEVEIVKVEGNKLIVKPLKQHKEVVHKTTTKKVAEPKKKEPAKKEASKKAQTSKNGAKKPQAKKTVAKKAK